MKFPILPLCVGPIASRNIWILCVLASSVLSRVVFHILPSTASLTTRRKSAVSHPAVGGGDPQRGGDVGRGEAKSSSAEVVMAPRKRQPLLHREPPPGRAPTAAADSGKPRPPDRHCCSRAWSRSITSECPSYMYANSTGPKVSRG